jgi:hypothetical protein
MSSLGISGGIKDITQFFDDLKIKSLEQELTTLKEKCETEQRTCYYQKRQIEALIRENKQIHKLRIELRDSKRTIEKLLVEIDEDRQLLGEIQNGTGEWESTGEDADDWYCALTLRTKAYRKLIFDSDIEDSEDEDEDEDMDDDSEPVLPPLVPEDGIGMSKITEYLPTTSSTIGGT